MHATTHDMDINAIGLCSKSNVSPMSSHFGRVCLELRSSRPRRAWKGGPKPQLLPPDPLDLVDSLNMQMHPNSANTYNMFSTNCELDDPWTHPNRLTRPTLGELLFHSSPPFALWLWLWLCWTQLETGPETELGRRRLWGRTSLRRYCWSLLCRWLLAGACHAGGWHSR